MHKPAATESLEREICALIVDVLNLPGVSPDALHREVPLIGGPLGLDSIDALQLAVALERTYGVPLALDEQKASEAFVSVASLACYVTLLKEPG